MGLLLESSTFYVKNKDQTLAKCEWVGDSHANILEDFYLPEFISDYFDSWLEGRTPPNYRANIQKMLEGMGLLSTRSILDVSLGLSLIDTFWVTADIKQRWQSVSLFSNPFNKLIASMAFSGTRYKDIIGSKSPSPEFDTDGMLAKCWRREGPDNSPGIWLYKTGTYPEMEDLRELNLRGADNLGFLAPGSLLPQVGLEPYAEVAAHQVLDALGWVHVPYTLCKYHNHVTSACPVMTSEHYMLQDMATFRNWKRADVRALAEQFSFTRELAQMYIFDFLMLGVDRHAGNYGVILDADTLDFEWFAPLFDHGNNMLSNWDNPSVDDKEFVARKDRIYPDLRRNCQAAKGMGIIFRELSNLIDFQFDDRAFGDYPSWALRRLEGILKLRLEQFYLM